jgi:CheY-like chemotaxis protein
MGGQCILFNNRHFALQKGIPVMLKPKILVIDDNHDVLDLLEVFLYRDYNLISAVNGFEGLAKANEHLPGCIMTDIMMPVMDGIKFFNMLRKREETAKIPVFAITSFVKKITTKSLINMGFAGVFKKPLNREIILDALSKALSNHN